jgi:hypothetical protein
MNKKWSSFEQEQAVSDKWREFLKEGKEENIEELSWKGIKRGAAKAGRFLRGEPEDYSYLPGAQTDRTATPSPSATMVQAEEVPVQLFSGDKALYSKLFSTVMSRFNNKDIQGQRIKLDKAQVQNTVKQILKDLSAQLRASGMKVQESHIPTIVELIIEEVEKTQILEAAYTGAQTAGQGTPKNAAEKWIAAGKPQLTTVNGNNLVTRDADHYANAERGILKPAALAYAKAQVAWLQKNKPDQSIPSMLSNAIQATSAAPQAKHYGGDKTATGSRVAPKQGQVDAGRAVGGKIVALVGQAAGADVKDRELRKMVTSDIQQDLKAIIMKVVKPHLQQYLQGTNIKLRESKEEIDEKE